jgi:rhomboid family GlyGly-CTERM serine protease
VPHGFLWLEIENYAVVFPTTLMTHPGYRAIIAHWAIPMAIAAIAAFLQAAGSIETWRLERGLALAEPWRLASGQLMHLSWMHMLMNLAGLGIVWALFGRDLQARQWAAAIFACGAGVNLGLLGFSPDLDWYVGFSGILHGLLAAALLVRIFRRPTVLTALVLIGLAAKLAWEQLGGGEADTAHLIGGTVVVDAHFYGALAGAAWGGFLILIRRRAP